jgi:hypothetical protein
MISIVCMQGFVPNGFSFVIERTYIYMGDDMESPM